MAPPTPQEDRNTNTPGTESGDEAPGINGPVIPPIPAASRRPSRLGLGPLRSVRRTGTRIHNRITHGQSSHGRTRRSTSSSVSGPAAPVIVGDEDTVTSATDVSGGRFCFGRSSSILSRIGRRRKSAAPPRTVPGVARNQHRDTTSQVLAVASNVQIVESSPMRRDGSTGSLSSASSISSESSLRRTRQRALQFIRARRGRRATWEVNELAESMFDHGQISEAELAEILQSESALQSDTADSELDVSAVRSPGEMALRVHILALAQREEAASGESSLDPVDEAQLLDDFDDVILAGPGPRRVLTSDSTYSNVDTLSSRGAASSIDKPGTPRTFQLHRRSTTSTAVGTVRGSVSSGGDDSNRNSLSSAWRRLSHPTEHRRRDTPTTSSFTGSSHTPYLNPPENNDSGQSTQRLRTPRSRRLSLGRLSRTTSRTSNSTANYVQSSQQAREHVPAQFQESGSSNSQSMGSIETPDWEVEVGEVIPESNSGVESDDIPSSSESTNMSVQQEVEEFEDVPPPVFSEDRGFHQPYYNVHARQQRSRRAAPHENLTTRELRRAEDELRRTIQLASQRQQEAGGDGIVDETFIMNELRRLDPRVLGFNPNHIPDDDGKSKQKRKKKKKRRSRRRSTRTSPGKLGHSRNRSECVDWEHQDGSKSERVRKTSSRRGSRASDFSDWETVPGSESETEEEKPLDPIMLTELEPDDVTYTFRRPNGSGIVYKVETLIDYMLSSGEFREPESRLEFSETDLAEIDAIAAAHDIRRPSLVDSVRNSSKQLEELREQQNALFGVERCLGEQVSEIIAVCENVYSHEEGEMNLVMRIFPNIRHYYQQLRSVDAEYALKCIDQYKTFLIGPPNRRTRDRFNLIPSCIRFFDSLAASRY